MTAWETSIQLSWIEMCCPMPGVALNGDDADIGFLMMELHIAEPGSMPSKNVTVLATRGKINEILGRFSAARDENCE